MGREWSKDTKEGYRMGMVGAAAVAVTVCGINQPLYQGSVKYQSLKIPAPAGILYTW